MVGAFHTVGFKPAQRGATLVVAMLILIVLTILGTSAMSASNLQLKMSNHALQKAISFHEAEDARETAERRAREIASSGDPFPDADPGMYDLTVAGATRPAVTTRAFWQTPANYIAVGSEGGYVIEFLGTKSVMLDDRTSSNTMKVYRLSAYGKGRDGVTETVSQSLYLEN